MKNVITLISVCLFSSIHALAISNAADRHYSFCDDPAKIDSLFNRSGDSVEKLKSDGFQIDRILVSKVRKQIYLISGNSILRSYPVALGQDPYGPKQFEGDGKTPEGIYSIDFKNPNSNYTKALHISYPNQQDLKNAAALGKSAGGDIMIHGFPTDPNKKKWVSFVHPLNWTRGCIAVNDQQIEEIYNWVKEETLVEICKTPTTEEEKRTVFVLNIKGELTIY